MARNIALGIGALLLATLLILTFGALTLRRSGAEEVMGEGLLGDGDATNRAIAEGRDPQQTLGAVQRSLDLAVFPLAVAAAGVFVGLFVKGRAWPVIALGLSPLLVAFVAGRSWALWPWTLSVLYLLLASVSGQVVAALRATSAVRNDGRRSRCSNARSA